MKKILIVDDNKEFRSTVADSLPKETYEVTTAEDGMEGFEKLKTLSPDLVILDLMMPKLSGIAFLNRMKEEGLKSKILISTQLGNMDTISHAVGQGLDVGVKGYIIKSSESLEMIVKEIEKHTQD